MPIYEYQCLDCANVFEDWQSGFEEKELKCPKCGGRSKRLISHSSFHLKGGGWFADGYGGAHSGSQPGEAEKPAEAPSHCPARSESGGVEAAPAKKTSDTSSAGSAS